MKPTVKGLNLNVKTDETLPCV